MKSFISLFIIAAGLILFQGCDKNNGPAAGSDGILGLLNADTSDFNFSGYEQVKDEGEFGLTYKFEKGTKRTYRFLSQTVDTSALFADTTLYRITTDKRTYVLTAEVKEVDADGTGELEFVITGVSYELKMKEGDRDTSIVFNSTMKVDSSERMKYFEFLSLVDAPFSAKINKNGKIIEVFRADKIANKMIEMSGMKDSISTDEKISYVGQVSEQILKPFLGQVTREMYEKPVKLNFKWEQPRPPVNNQTLAMENTFIFTVANRYKKSDDNLVLVDAGVTTKVAVNPALKAQGIDMQTPIFKGWGSIVFNQSGGHIQKSKTKTLLVMDYSAQAPAMKTGQMMTMRHLQMTYTLNILEYIK
ncbi:MAG: hypothetical protein HUU43_09145 [Ignavibacteriaceae bacterium]|nr:DUF6263 family protein [Ignavibacteriaceae bacterium]NUM71003.1 hypothetical protein [Ignavibacteriaceae bacterium]